MSSALDDRASDALDPLDAKVSVSRAHPGIRLSLKGPVPLGPWPSVRCSICIGLQMWDTFLEDMVMLLKLWAVLWKKTALRTNKRGL